MPRLLVLLAAVLTLAGCGANAEPTQAIPSSSPSATASATPTTPPPSSKASTVSTSVDETLVRNRLYSTGRLARTSCTLPTKRLATKTAISRYSTVLVACLNRAWRPSIERSGNYFAPPTVQIVEADHVSPCGQADDASAFYCSENSAIYLDWEYYADEDPDQTPIRIEVLDVLAHEYGHHVQHLTGILGFFDSRTDGLSGKALWPDTRRMELQATCLGAVFQGANRRTLNLTGERLVYFSILQEQGDEEPPFDHGSPESNEAWTGAAFASGDPKSCNTWTAPAAKVS
ncbi:hypothetical protein FB561_2908 [Kribbella amoyensis]|uniref:Metalloprotease n=1 Tax=Kribbella amoyensis TaxID=996641 RepID=A0A561BSC7_9ACTN|nr:neutral zinc metallopeptidase [Kribbella amoyensis]TWD81785.1 hypothetical protein FB561_2908 [Kribbella amoyensis]